MKTVQLVLDGKAHTLLSVAPDSTVYDALRTMADAEIGALVVLDEGRLVGIFSERDYARKVILLGKSSKATLVREVMTPRVLCVRPDQTIDQCMALMTDKHVRHLPVVDQTRVVGVISIGDVVKEVISHQQFVISQLENYISS